MIKETKYDLFISYSRKDYVDEKGNEIEGNIISRIVDFLDANKISHWIDKEGIYSGNQFAELIADAVQESRILLFVSSANSNESDYTAGEIKEAVDQHKQIIPFLIDDTPYNKKFRILVNCCDFIDYYNKPDAAFYSLLKAVREGLEDYYERQKTEEARMAKMKREEMKREILQKIADKERDYALHEGELTKISSDILELRKEIGDDEKVCPVCGMKVPVSDRFCVKCGWKFNPVHAVKGKNDERLLLVAKNNWKSLKGWSDMYNRYVSDANERQKDADEKIAHLTQECTLRDEQIAALQAEIEELKARPVAATIAIENEIETEKAAESVRTFTVGEVKFDMRLIKKGLFWMGAAEDDKEAYPDEKPIHKAVITKDYYIAEIPVTQALWKEIMGANPSEFKGANRPVENVSWTQCQHFIDKLNKRTGAKFRMPTEAEWEYAAKCGDVDSYKYCGDSDLDAVAWYYSNSESMTHEVRQKKPNSFGLYDMTGNVSEWCSDWKNSYKEGEISDPTGGEVGSFKVFKGGSWYDFGTRCRVSYRGNASSSRCSHDVGMRLAMSVK